jgi:uncharacterized protein (TIGR02466 family)
MNEMLIFPSTVLITDLNTDLDFSKIKTEIYQIKDYYSGENRSNIKSYQSPDLLSIDLSQAPSLRDLIAILNQNISAFARNKVKFSIGISNVWFNVTEPYGYQTLHDHHGSIFSGTVTVVKPDNSGNIVFTRSDNAKFFIPPEYHNQTDFTHITTYFDIPVGNSLFFWSWEKHYVEQNQSDADRITLSFNTYYK